MIEIYEEQASILDSGGELTHVRRQMMHTPCSRSVLRSSTFQARCVVMLICHQLHTSFNDHR
jgi:hypothetical protein